MKKLLNIGMIFTLVVGLFFAITPINKASASYDKPYDGSDPYSTGCAYKSPITYETKYIYKNGVKIGYLQLKGSAYCHTAWGYVKFYSAAPYDNYAYVNVDSYTWDSSHPIYWRTSRSCASPGGNGMVMKGQTSCYTAQLWDKDPYKATAAVYIDYTRYAITGRH